MKRMSEILYHKGDTYKKVHNEWWVKVEMGEGDEWCKIKNNELSEWKKLTLGRCGELNKIYNDGMEEWLQCAKCDSTIWENDEPCPNCTSNKERKNKDGKNDND